MYFYKNFYFSQHMYNLVDKSLGHHKSQILFKRHESSGGVKFCFLILQYIAAKWGHKYIERQDKIFGVRKLELFSIN